MRTIYLCSRVAKDARELNERVAKSLVEAGFYVYVPHQVAPNNPGPTDRFNPMEIFRMDFDAMRSADLCVAVGKLGKDCSWELGYFYGQKVPIIRVAAPHGEDQSSPMLLGSIPSARYVDDPAQVGHLLRKWVLENYFESVKR